MVPNHIMQLISLTAMEPPVSFQADAVRNEQAKILRAVQPLDSEDVLYSSVRGQYGKEWSEEKRVAGIPLRTWSGPRIENRNISGVEAEHRQTGDGPECRFTSAPGNGWPNVTPKSPSSSSARRLRYFATLRSTIIATNWSCRYSLWKGYR